MPMAHFCLFFLASLDEMCGLRLYWASFLIDVNVLMLFKVVCMMNQIKFNKLLPKRSSMVLLATLLLPFTNTQAAPVWTGTADYLNATSAEGDEDTVGPFNQYHFGSGFFLTSALTNPVVGETVSGWFQTSVDSHKLLSSGQTVNAPNFNTRGTGSGYELTAVSTFSFQVTNIDPAGTISFNNPTGKITLYFDTSPDYSFETDTGFSDGEELMTGNITGGNGVLSSFGIGAGQYSLALSGSLGSTNSLVYNPTVGGGDALFSLSANASPLINSVSSVQGHSVANGFVATTTGTLTLTAVPVPAAVWLMIGGMMTLLGLHKRKMSA